MYLLTLSKFKRWLATLLLAIGIATVVKAETVEIDGLYYSLNTTAHTASVTYQTSDTYNYSTLRAEVVIPETITVNGETYTVTGITDQAFTNCKSLEYISIPSTVTWIGECKSYSGTSSEYSNYEKLPFYHCTSLKYVRFEDGSEPVSLGSCYVSHDPYSSNNIDSSKSRGIFYDCPLEEVYIGRTLTYDNYNNVYPFNQWYAEYYGYSAFYGQKKLAKITIGQQCEELPDYLFYGNDALTIITLPNVTKIGNHTFDGCSKLTSLNLGNNLESIGQYAFHNCRNLTKLTLPSTTVSIGEFAFYNCSSVAEVTVGESMKSIGRYAFCGCEAFTALILPDTFTDLEEYAFKGCKKLTVAKLGTSLTSVPRGAFKDCPALSEMVIPATAKSIGDEAFSNDSGLATIIMNEGLETIGDEAFRNNSGIMQFSIPGTVTKMGRNCFYGCTGTTYLTFRNGTSTLTIDNSSCKSAKIDALTTNSDYRDREYDYFADCPIRILTLGRNIEYRYYNSCLMYDYDGASFKPGYRSSAPFVNNKELVSVTIGPNVTFLYDHLLNGCSNIKKLSLPDGLEEINSYALANCTSITQLTFPKNLVLLGNYACSNNDALTSVTFDEEPGNSLSMQIHDGVFSNCPGLTTLTFPSKTTYIGNRSFYNTPNITEITFVDGKQSLQLGYGAYADHSSWNDNRMPLFGNSRLKKLYIGRNIYFSAKAETGYSPFYNQPELTDVQFSQAGTVTYCYDYLLFKVNNCGELKLPESLKSIGNSSFREMTTLVDLEIPAGVTSIGTYAFADNVNLISINIPPACSWLKEGLFSGCRSLTSMNIPSAVTQMDNCMFAGCESLKLLSFEGNSEMIKLGYGATDSYYDGLFRDCPLETLELDRWLFYDTQMASRSPFYSIKSLKNLHIGENVTMIDKYMFSYCTGLEEVYLPDNIESVGLWGFRGCTSLKKVRFSEKLSQISDYGFSECSSLDNVVFPESMTSISDNSFSNCTALKNIDLGTKLMVIGPAAFKNNTSLELVELPESLYGLGVEAFANCTSLLHISIQGVSSVGKQAFQGCSNLQSVELNSKITSLGEDSFADCGNIKSVKSLAEFPPEGLVNFPEQVPAGGTLFVPEYSLDYYRYSPTWENWFDIRPLSEFIAVEAISVTAPAEPLKAGETVQLIAEVVPANATNKTIVWSTDDAAVATVDDNGLVTAIAPGRTTIKAIAADGSRKMSSVEIEVMLIKGDSNNNGAVTITDAVNTANYASGNEVETFCFEAADVDTDGEITSEDALGTVDIILEQEQIAFDNESQSLQTDSGCLAADDFSLPNNESKTINIRLDSSVELVALQADITLPDGVNLTDIKCGSRISQTHSLSHRYDSGKLRVVLFDTENSTFAPSDEPVMELTIKSETDNNTGDITLSHIIASDKEANEYELTYTGGRNLGLSGIDSNHLNPISIATGDEEVTIFNAAGKKISIHTIDGKTLAGFVARTDAETWRLTPGIYIVTADNIIEKVIIR